MSFSFFLQVRLLVTRASNFPLIPPSRAFVMIEASSIPTSAAKLARDLRADLKHLRARGIDPDTFLGGTLASIARRAEKIAYRRN